MRYRSLVTVTVCGPALHSHLQFEFSKIFLGSFFLKYFALITVKTNSEAEKG